MPRYHLTFKAMQRADKKAALIDIAAKAAFICALAIIALMIGLTP